MKHKYFYLIGALLLLCSCSKEEKLYGVPPIYDKFIYVVENGEVVKKQDYTISFPASGGEEEIVFFVEDKSDLRRAIFVQDFGKDWLVYKDFINRYASNSWERETLLYTDESGEKIEVTGIVYPVCIFATQNTRRKGRSVVCYIVEGSRDGIGMDPEILHIITINQKGK